MKMLFALAIFALLAGCSEPEKEEYVPYPGGKCCDTEPRT